MNPYEPPQTACAPGERQQRLSVLVWFLLAFMLVLAAFAGTSAIASKLLLTQLGPQGWHPELLAMLVTAAGVIAAAITLFGVAALKNWLERSRQ